MEKPVLGQHKRNFDLVPYQNGWEEIYQIEADLLRETLGEKALSIEHIGSTSIPGMLAKPIIDIMVAVVSLSQTTELIPAVEGLGYEYGSRDTIPERRFFAKESGPEYRTHHLNLTPHHSGFWKNQLAFRNYLRAHPQSASDYIHLKQRIAEQYARTHQLDLNAKTEFVTRVLELAEKEAMESS